MKKNKIIVCLIILLQSSFAFAFELQNISSSELTLITQEVATSFKHSNAGPASQNEKDFGFEVGILGGDSKSTKIGELVGKTGSATAASNIPKLGFLFGLTLIKGFSLEYIYQPEIKTNDIKFNNYSAAVKSQMNQFIDLPLSTALKLYFVDSRFNWNQTISSVATDIEFSQKSYGMDIQISKKYSYLEPYANLGYIASKGDMNSSGASLFDSAYTSKTSATENTNGTSYGVGVNAALEFINFSFEVNSTYTNLSTVFKTSANF